MAGDSVQATPFLIDALSVYVMGGVWSSSGAGDLVLCDSSKKIYSIKHSDSNVSLVS